MLCNRLTGPFALLRPQYLYCSAGKLCPSTCGRRRSFQQDGAPPHYSSSLFSHPEVLCATCVAQFFDLRSWNWLTLEFYCGVMSKVPHWVSCAGGQHGWKQATDNCSCWNQSLVRYVVPVHACKTIYTNTFFISLFCSSAYTIVKKMKSPKTLELLSGLPYFI